MDLLDGAICVVSDAMYVTGISPGLLYKGSHLLNKGSWSLTLSWDLSSSLDCLQLHLGRSPYHAGLDACDNNQHPVVTVRIRGVDTTDGPPTSDQ